MVFDYFDNCQIRTAAIQDIKTDFAAGEEGIREFRFSAGRKPFYYIAYTPLGMNDWMISYIVPVRAAEASYDFIRDYEIIFIIVPIVAPVFAKLHMDPLWIGILLALNLQTSFLTPPFGFALFYLKGVAPDTVKTSDMYRGIVPFILIQLLVLALVIVFPEII